MKRSNVISFSSNPSVEKHGALVSVCVDDVANIHDMASVLKSKNAKIGVIVEVNVICFEMCRVEWGKMGHQGYTEVPNLETEAPPNRPSPPTAQLGSGRKLKFCMNSLLVNTNNNTEAIF